jgi:hypothetical protein
MKTSTHFWPYLVHLFLDWEILQTKVVDKIRKHMKSSIFFPENIAICEIMWKNIVESGRPQMPVWRMSIACWTEGYKPTLGMHSTHCFSTAAMVALLPLSVVIVRCLYCYGFHTDSVSCSECFQWRIPLSHGRWASNARNMSRLWTSIKWWWMWSVYQVGCVYYVITSLWCTVNKVTMMHGQQNIKLIIAQQV